MVRSYSVNTNMSKFEKYISPMLRRDTVKPTGQPRQGRHSAKTLNSRATGLATTQPRPQAQNSKPTENTMQPFAGQLQGIGSAVNTSSASCRDRKRSKEPTHAIGLHRKINKLESVIVRQQHQVKDLKHKLVEVRGGALHCCCEELKAIFEEKEQKLLQLSNYWKAKTQ